MPAGLWPRREAAIRLSSVLEGEIFVPFSADELSDPRDRALANKLVTLALRRNGHINEIISVLLERGIPKRSGLFVPILRIALTELLFMPDQPAHPPIFIAVEVIKQNTKTMHLKRLLNGVLREAQRRADDFRSLDPYWVLPEWLRTKWVGDYGNTALLGFAEALLEEVPLDISLLEDDDTLIEKLGGKKLLPKAIRVSERDKSVRNLPGYAEGQWWVQDVAATLAARLIDLPEGARVLDVCAAPGGKTAQLVNAGYKVTALDNDRTRMSRLADNMERLKFDVEIVIENASQYEPDELFDAVLVDAPCTATGTFRRHPEVLWNRTLEDIHSRKQLQREIVENALKCLKPGGLLIYCVCSLEAEEGEDQAVGLTDDAIGLQTRAVTATEIEGFEHTITPQGWIRTYPGMAMPNNVDGTMDGFFIGRFVKAN